MEKTSVLIKKYNKLQKKVNILFIEYDRKQPRTFLILHNFVSSYFPAQAEIKVLKVQQWHIIITCMQSAANMSLTCIVE